MLAREKTICNEIDILFFINGAKIFLRYSLRRFYTASDSRYIKLILIDDETKNISFLRVHDY